jgi:hypothetical protein
VDYRGHWREPAFWRWWWRCQVPIGAKIVVALVAVALLAGGGYAAETALPAQAARSAGVAQVLTVVRTYTVRGPTKAKERVLVRRVTGPGSVAWSTAHETTTVPVTVSRPPRYETRLVTIAGRPTTLTVVKRKALPARTVTSSRVSTQTEPTTVVDTTTVTVEKKKQPPPGTVTITSTVQATVVETTTLGHTVTVTTTAPGITGTVP